MCVNVLKLFLILLLGHMIADFVIQTKYMNQNKRIFTHSLYSKGLLFHCIHHLVLSFLLCLIFMEWQSNILPIIVIIMALHYIIDLVKIKLENSIIPSFRSKQWVKKYWFHHLFEKNTTYFIFDQLLHGLSIYLVLALFHAHPSGNEIYSLFKTISIEGQMLAGDMRLIVLGILFILLTYTSAYLIAAIMSDLQEQKVNDEIASTLDFQDENMEKFKEEIHLAKTDIVINESYQAKDDNYTIQLQYQKYSNTSESSRGKYIGILERILIAIFVVQNLSQGLAFLIAMKTLTRFKQFEDKDFAEYYLIGTLLSLIIGIAVAWVIHLNL